MDHEIVITNLMKNFGDVTAVNGLNLYIGRGELFGFFGTERRRENDHDQHALWPVGTYCRIGPDRRL